MDIKGNKPPTRSALMPLQKWGSGWVETKEGVSNGQRVN